LRTEREVAEIKAQYEARLAARAEAAIERAKILQDHITTLKEEVTSLRDQLRKANLAAQEVVNSTFAAMRIAPPHAAARPPRPEGMRAVSPVRTWEDARAELEKRDSKPSEERPGA